MMSRSDKETDAAREEEAVLRRVTRKRPAAESWDDRTNVKSSDVRGAGAEALDLFHNSFGRNPKCSHTSHGECSEGVSRDSIGRQTRRSKHGRAEQPDYDQHMTSTPVKPHTRSGRSKKSAAKKGRHVTEVADHDSFNASDNDLLLCQLDLALMVPIQEQQTPDSTEHIDLLSSSALIPDRSESQALIEASQGNLSTRSACQRVSVLGAGLVCQSTGDTAPTPQAGRAGYRDNTRMSESEQDIFRELSAGDSGFDNTSTNVAGAQTLGCNTLTANTSIAEVKVHVRTVLNDLFLAEETSPKPSSGSKRKAQRTVQTGTTQHAQHAQPSQPRTPQSAWSGGSLRDKIKKRLHENAWIQSPSAIGPQAILRERMIEQAHRDSIQIQQGGSEWDIGPFYGLPSKVQELLETHRGISQLYDWQDECLNLPAVQQGKNLIYSLPTSGGKTLVAEILILRELICKKRDALLILPFISIVQEKVRNMSLLAADLDFLVEEYAGSKGRFPPLKRRSKQSLYVATIEKAHSLVNSLLEHGRINHLGLVVVDELHMLGEGGSRGATLEMSLTKLLHACDHTQIIGMSATLNNTADLQLFLSADVYTNNFRPVELTEYVKLEDNIYRVNNKALCPSDQLEHDRVLVYQYTAEMKRQDVDQLYGLVSEVIPQHSCLLFCPTKKNCENVATNICKMMSKYRRAMREERRVERKSLLRELFDDGNGKICPILQYTIQFGVAYHHSGLTMDERKVIEEAYSDGVLCLLACTSTLATGVNLPAKRVIIRQPYVGRKFLNPSQYKQMAGRAGRAGIDSSGESILVTPKIDREKVRDLLSQPIECCKSSVMYDEGKGLRSLILSTVGLKVTPTTESVFEFMNRSLLFIQREALQCDLASATQLALQRLIELDLVKQRRVVIPAPATRLDPQPDTQTTPQPASENVDYLLEVTLLGRATFKGSVALEDSAQLYKDLHQAKESLVLSNYLHLLYLVTPYDATKEIKPDWMTYFTQMNMLSPIELRVAALIGVPEGYIAKMASGQASKQQVEMRVVKRFYLTLMLYDLWRKKTIWEVAAIYQQARGYLQNLLTSAASFASCVYHFCEEMEEFWAFQVLFGNFVRQLSYCVSLELIPLMEIPGVKLGRAKQLFHAGYKCLSAVAHSDPNELVRVLQNLPRRTARQIVASAKVLLSEKAEALLEEVEELVSIPASFPEILSQSQPSLAQSSLSVSTPQLCQSSDVQ